MTLGSMTDARRSSRKRPPPGRRDRETDLANYLVPPAMLVVAIAMGVASNLHFATSPEMAVAVGAALFCAMLLCHVLLRAADIADKAEEAAAERRVELVASPMPAPDRLSPDYVAPDYVTPDSVAPDHLPPDLMAAGDREAGAVDAGLTPLPGRTSNDEFRSVMAVPDPVAEPEFPLLSNPELADQPGRADRVAQRLDDAEFGRGLGALAAQDIHGDTQDAAALPPLAPPSFSPPSSLPSSLPSSPAGWLFRPVELRAPAVEPERTLTEASAVVAAIGALRPTIADQVAPARPLAAGTGAASIAEADRIDHILKRLAQQIKEGTAQTALDAARSAPGAPAVGLAHSPGRQTTGESDADTLVALAADRPDTALECAVDALRSTVEAMRHVAVEHVAADPESSREDATAMPPNAVEARIAAIADALARESVDVVLAPILALEGEEARHFEVTVRLRDAGGELIESRSVASGAGLLPLLDALSVRHAAGFALKLERRGRSGAVFSAVAGESLESDGFVGDVAGRFAQGIADRMVLSFAQAEMRGLGPAQIAALGDLAELGFRFALTGVADLDMDFDALKATGFQFVKLDAAVFLGGLPCGGDIVPASDLCLHFADLGIEVIVSGIGDERARDALVGCGVAYGQGPLYGEPRPIPFAAGSAIAA